MRIWLWRVTVLVVALALWEGVARMLNPLLYVGPTRLPAALARVLATRDLPPLPGHVWLTLGEIAAAYALAVAGGLWVGFLLGLRRTVGRIYEPLLATLYAVPSVIWYPSLMLFFGLGPASKIAFGFLLGFFPVTLAVLAGIRQVPATLVTVAVSMGASRAQIAHKVLLPAVVPSVLTAMRVAMVFAMLGALLAEMLAGNRGMGFQMQRMALAFRAADLFAATAIVSVLSIAAVLFLEHLNERLGRWR